MVLGRSVIYVKGRVEVGGCGVGMGDLGLGRIVGTEFMIGVVGVFIIGWVFACPGYILLFSFLIRKCCDII